MYIDQYDELFDDILNSFYKYLKNIKFFDKINKESNFVKHQDFILKTIKTFVDKISDKQILNVVKKSIHVENIINIIKRYCAFYIYLGIAYHYKKTKDLYITNMIEISRYQKDTTYNIENFFNSENNSKIINYYTDIKNIIYLSQFKTMDKIKIIINNNPIKYESTVNIINSIGEDHAMEYLLIKDNFDNLMKIIIFNFIYKNEEKVNLLNLLDSIEKKNTEYKYIDIVVSTQNKLLDFNHIQKFIISEKYPISLAEDIYDYLEEYRDNKQIILNRNNDFINYLFDNKIIIPITEEFLKYHKDNEHSVDYSNKKSDNNPDKGNRDNTKIKALITKINNIKNYYSPMIANNAKLKAEINSYFYKNFEPRVVVLYNYFDEMKIIQKLSHSPNASDYDLLVDLENNNKYPYINFKNFKKYGIKIRPQLTIQGIRAMNFKYKQNTIIETVIGHSNNPMNVIGIAFNSANISLDCINVKDMINVKSLYKNPNGYKAFSSVMNKYMNNQKGINNKLFYWLFDNESDIPILKSYINYNKNNYENNIKLMLEGLYYNYINIIYNNIINYLKSVGTIKTNDFYNIYNYYNKKFDFDLSPELKQKIINYAYTNNIKEVKIDIDEIDNLESSKTKNIIIPSIIKKINKNDNMIYLNDNRLNIANIEVFKQSENELDDYICFHNVKWMQILKLNKKTEEFSQGVFEFVKKYIKLNNTGEYICKSCDDYVPIKKYVLETYYDEENEVLLTTNILVSTDLEDMDKYRLYSKTIKNIEKNLERIAYLLNISIYTGNTPVVKLRRKMIIKDTIDMILLHTDWLKKQQNDRIINYSKKYGINKEFTKLFFFELKDDIFLTKADDTDYYKQIKYNNIIGYLIYNIVCDINMEQINNFKPDKLYNIVLFNNIKKELFENLLIRINQKEKIEILNIPLLCYTLFYISGMILANKLWLYNSTTDNFKNDTPLEKAKYRIYLHKTIIHTLIDLINTITEANFDENKNYMYEIINMKFYNTLTKNYNNIKMFEKIENANKTSITNIKKTDKNYDYITLNSNNRNDYITNIFKQCNVKFKSGDYSLDKKAKEYLENYYSTNYNFNIHTNCPSGEFHKWEYINNKLICKKCNEEYSENNKNSINYIDKIKHNILVNLSKKYCISGDLHIFDNNICKLCKFKLNDKLSNNELLKMETNIDKKHDEIAIKEHDYMEQKHKNDIKNENIIINTIHNLDIVYKKETNNKLENYVIDFIDKLIKIMGNKITIKELDSTIYLKDTIFIINHDYLGNNIKPINISSKDDIIKIEKNHQSFNKDILYYKDNNNKIYLYYDVISLQYIGYSKNNKDITKTKSNVSLEIILSLKDSILLLGVDSKYQQIDADATNNIIYDILRKRNVNLKQIINNSISIITKINNKKEILLSDNENTFKLNENIIVNEFVKKLKKINIDDVFSDHFIIINNISIDYNIDNINLEYNDDIENKYLSIEQLLVLNNSDNKLIFYLLYNLSLLLDNNMKNTNISELARLIVYMLIYFFNLYNIKYNNYEVRKYNYIINNLSPSDLYENTETIVIGDYNELVNTKDIVERDVNEETNDNDKINMEEALDIDDYEVNDDVDERAEALDGYED